MLLQICIILEEEDIILVVVSLTLLLHSYSYEIKSSYSEFLQRLLCAVVVKESNNCNFFLFEHINIV